MSYEVVCEDLKQYLTPNADIKRLLLVTVPWDVRKKGGIELQECIRAVWDQAICIGSLFAQQAREEGYAEGRRDGVKQAVVAVKSKENNARHTQELETERMWGFEVGWRLASEKGAEK
ncbi:unnamed protein product [Mycena citricolor]|uniref:Uncharacterized protein n=1 Tax=Mycena citricolor TaxID=2018698 RepID=A0AAD2HX39_9AGAR|nr:unnamed protein product [Mycena citricolor]